MRRLLTFMAVVSMHGFLILLDAQGVGFLQTLMIGSEGRGPLRVPEAEEGFEDLQSTLVKSFGLRPKPSVQIRLAAAKDSPVLERISVLQSDMDSTDLLLGICRGAWEPDPGIPEFATLVSPHREKITIDYLFNMMEFMPALDGVLFLIPPSPQELSATLFAGTGRSVAGGGKYLVVLRFRGQSEYPAIMEAFDDIISELASADQADTDKNGRISFSEWLSECQRRMDKAFVVQIYKVTSAIDLPIRELR